MPGPVLTWFAAAIVLGALAAAPLSADARITVSGALAAFVIMLFRYEPRLIRAAALAALVASVAYTTIRTQLEPQVNQTRTMRFAGTVLEARTTPDGLHEYQVALDGSIRVLVLTHGSAPLGARIVIRGRLEAFDGPRNPGEPSEQEIERENGLQGRIASATILEVRAPRAHAFASTIAAGKAWAADQLRLRLGDPGAAIVAGELWGARDALPPDLRTAFQETGTVHILVTAGLHVGLVATLAVAACMLLGVSRSVSCGIAIALIWAFAMLSGAHIPAVRAASMASMALLARACGRATYSWNALAAGAIAVVIYDPLDVSGASFWLSFCCVGAIFALVAPLERALDRYALPHRLREALVLTIATQLGTWPITAAVFLQFAPYAIAGNAAIVPCVPMTMVLGALQIALAWCAPLAQAAANLNGWIIAWMIGVVRVLSGLPDSSVVTTPAPTWAIAFYEAALVFGTALVRRGAVTLTLGMLIVTTSYVLAPPYFDRGQLRITVLDVGQADAIVIETPARHVLLVDAGGRLERGSLGNDSQAEQVGERIVVPFLIRQGIHAVDAVILSHPHGDHVGGCAPVLRKLRVSEIADSGQTYGGHAYHDCLATAHADDVPLVYPRAGLMWRTDDGVTLRFIGPELPFIRGRNAINDNSVAFILQYRTFRMLFTGDAGAAAEQRFLAEGVDLHADVLKVGHHGSAYSSSPEFIAAVHPRYAIISVGRNNLFGHPAPSTIDTLERSGAHVYRTDENGATSILSCGNGESVAATIHFVALASALRRRI